MRSAARRTRSACSSRPAGPRRRAAPSTTAGEGIVVSDEQIRRRPERDLPALERYRIYRNDRRDVNPHYINPKQGLDRPPAS